MATSFTSPSARRPPAGLSISADSAPFPSPLGSTAPLPCSSSSSSSSSSGIPPPPKGPLKLVIPVDPVLSDTDRMDVPRHVQMVMRVLENLHLQTYFDTLQENGYDDVRSLLCLEEKDLLEMKFKPKHAKRLLKWCLLSTDSAFNPDTDDAKAFPSLHSPMSECWSAPPSPSEEVNYRAAPLTCPAFAITPGSPPTPNETYIHSPYTFIPYAAVPSPGGTLPTGGPKTHIYPKVAPKKMSNISGGTVATTLGVSTHGTN